MRKLVALLALTASFALGACNTIHGAANDVKSVGDCADGVDNNC